LTARPACAICADLRRPIWRFTFSRDAIGTLSREIENTAAANVCSCFRIAIFAENNPHFSTGLFAITTHWRLLRFSWAVMVIAGALLAFVIYRRRDWFWLPFSSCATNQIRKLILVEACIAGLRGQYFGLFCWGFAFSLFLIFL